MPTVVARVWEVTAVAATCGARSRWKRDARGSSRRPAGPRPSSVPSRDTRTRVLHIILGVSSCAVWGEPDTAARLRRALRGGTCGVGRLGQVGLRKSRPDGNAGCFRVFVFSFACRMSTRPSRRASIPSFITFSDSASDRASHATHTRHGRARRPARAGPPTAGLPRAPAAETRATAPL